jgi:hypothetical protein
MPLVDDIQAETLDERRFTDAGHAGNSDAHRIAGMGQQFGQHVFGLRPMVGTGRFDERDRPCERAAVTSAERGRKAGGGVGCRHGGPNYKALAAG